MSGEDRFVRRLRSEISGLGGSGRVLVGPGDDAAVVAGSPRPQVVTTDLVVEGVDFLPGEDPEAIGRRAMAVNLSDLAAMGASPAFFVLAIGFPARLGEEYALAVARGALSRAIPAGAALAGGDLSDSERTVVSIALWGEPAGKPLLRSGARADDRLFLSGEPGRAAAGLRIARESRGSANPSNEDRRELLAAYRDPEPRLAIGLALAKELGATAAIDVSDGLGIDASRLAGASGVRAVLHADRLPISPPLARFAAEEGLDPLELVLSGGDDYELLFTVSPENEARIPRELGGVPLRRIGEMETGSGAILRANGVDREISLLGHDHLRDDLKR